MKLFGKKKATARYGGVDGPVSNTGPNSQTVALANSAQAIPANYNRMGLEVCTDGTASSTVFILLGSGTASATNFHFALTPASPAWHGQVAQSLWSGAFSLFSANTLKVGVVEV